MRRIGIFVLVALYAIATAAFADDASDALRVSAEQGDAGAQFKLGLSFAHGDGATQDYGEALQWYRRAARQKFAPAEFALANACFAGVALPEDIDGGLKWLRLAAQHGDAQARMVLGSLLQRGHLVGKDLPEAAKWLRLAAEQGDFNAQLFLGGMYAHGEGVSKSETDALKWWKRVAEQGDADSAYGVALMHRNGEGTAKDAATAFKWFQAAAAQGHEQAHLRLGQFYATGEGVGRDPEQAWFHFKMSAATPQRWKRLLDASPEMRDMLQQLDAKLSIEQKAAIALRLATQRATEAQQAMLQLRRRAQAGDAQAQYELARKLAWGESVDKDSAAAIGWWRKSAEQAYRDGMLELGMALWSADTPLRDRTQALRWLDRASHLGDTDASRFLGRIYWLGRDVAEDHARAWSYTSRCVGSKDGDCIAQLARFTHLGVGTYTDDSKARELYAQAIELGSNRGKCELGVLLDSLNEELPRSEQLVLQAAADGEAECQHRAGQISARDGHSEAALAWYEKSAAQGNRDSMRTAISMLLFVPQVRDVERAVRETERCWQHNVSTCAVVLGAYFVEIAQPPDPQRGKQFLQLAHEKGDRYATKILAQVDYFGDSEDAQARQLLESLAENDAEAALWLARLDAREDHGALARASLLKRRERFSLAANWLLSRWCRGASDCAKDVPSADRLAADIKQRLAQTHGDESVSLQLTLWDEIDLLAADPHSDREDGTFALRIAHLLPPKSSLDDGRPERNLEALALAQARSGDFKGACTSQTHAVEQIAQHEKTKFDKDAAYLAQTRMQTYCAGKPWNWRVYSAGYLFAENFGG